MRWQCLVVLCSLVSWGHCQAPGDGDSICLPGGALASVHPVYPNTFKPLMDSRDYTNLLEESDAVWQQVDVDGLGDGTLPTSVSFFQYSYSHEQIKMSSACLAVTVSYLCKKVFG